MLLFTVPLLNASVSNQMLQLYQKGSYIEACTLGSQNLKQIQQNEAQLSLYAFACLNADQIDNLNTPIKILNQTSESRANASYFSLLVLQKKLLIQSLYDNYPLKSLKLPTSPNLLSKVFDFYCQNQQAASTFKEYTDKINPRQTYSLYTIQVGANKTFAIDEYYDKILTKHHVY